MPISTIKKLWEKIDGRVLFVVGLLAGWATKGILIWISNWVLGKPIFKILFGWLFK